MSTGPSGDAGTGPPTRVISLAAFACVVLLLAAWLMALT